MKIRSSRIAPYLASRLSAVVLTALCASNASAQTLTKANNLDSLGSASSWVENIAPTTADILVWDATVTAAQSVAANNGGFYGGIRVTTAGGDISVRVASNGTATWSSNALIDLSSSDTANFNWTAGYMRIASTNYAPTISVAAGRTVTFGGTNAVLANQGNTKTLTLNGAGTINFNNSTITNFSGGAMTVLVNGAAVTVNGVSGAAATTVTSGSYTAGNAGALGTTTVTVNGGTLNTSVATVSGTGNVSMSSGALKLNDIGTGSLTLGTDRNFSMSGGTWTVSIGSTSSYDFITGNGLGVFSLTGGTLALGGLTDYGVTYQLLNGFASGTVGAGLTISGYDTTNYVANLSNTGVLSFTASAVPEPSTYAALTGIAILGFAATRRRRA